MADVRFSLSYLISSYLTPAGKRAAWNLSWMLAGRIVSQACLVIIVFMLTRTLGREQFGILSTALAIQGYVILLGSAGMPVIVTRELVRRPENASRIASTYFALAWAIGVAVAIVISVSVAFMHISNTERFVIITVVLGSAFACGNAQPIFDAFEHQALPAVVSAVSDLLLLGVTGILALNERLTLSTCAFLFFCKWAILNACLVLLAARLVPLRLADVSASEAKFIWHGAWPILIGSILYLIPNSGGVIIVRWLKGPSEAAGAGLAYQVFQAFAQISLLFHQVLRPHVLSTYGQESWFIKKALSALLLFLFLLAAITILGVWIAFRFILPTQFDDAFVCCLVAVGAGILLALVYFPGTYTVAMHAERINARVMLITAAVFILLSLLLVPYFGVLAQVIVLATTQLLCFLMFIYAVVRLRFQKNASRLPSHLHLQSDGELA
jgi:O-antigen/teichoic acid export membrane protein